MKKYIPNQIEPKWQKKWEEDKLYSTDLASTDKKYYCLAEFAYPSGDLHMGHWFTWGGADVFARFKRMHGYNVFFPNGFDAFGLPAENAAIKRNIHPREWTMSNIESMKKQYQTMGGSFSFEDGVITCLPGYYRWNQWIFLKMLEKEIAYKGKAFTNWCPKDQTVLADEQVVGGLCERCGAEVTKKEVSQWFLKITDYADRLLWPFDSAQGKDGNGLDWPKSVMEGQNNWIGKSEGAVINFDGLEVFTTRQDTIFGATFVVISPEHPLLKGYIKPENEKEVEKYLELVAKKSEVERKEEKEKTGVFTGSYVKNPYTNEQIPVWIADYVLMGYGTGAIMAVPAHDARDLEFAKKFNLPVVEVINSEGKLINSGEYNGLTANEAREKMGGKKKINYHLRDWSISRQRYWGTPIPIIYCSDCGTVPVPEEDLPVELDSPKAVKCPKCQREAKRETDTMDGFFDNSWYFFRFLDPENKKEIFGKEIVKNWLPLEVYFGGAEHTLGHTLYSRFFTKFFYDIGLVEFEEYARRRVNHGIVLGPDGEKMSKSRGNVVNPDGEVREYGADAIRIHMAFFMPYEGTAGPWISERIGGAYRFLQRVWGLQEKVTGDSLQLTVEALRIMHKTIKKVTEDIEAVKFNTAIAALMEWLNHLSKKEKVASEEYKTLLLLLAPFAPHVTEELWENMKEPKEPEESNESKVQKRLTPLTQAEGLDSSESNWSVHQQSWPMFDNKYLETEETAIAVQVNGKVRNTLIIKNDIVSNKEVVEKMALEDEKVQKFLMDKSVKRVVYVTGKIISIVTE